jgi:hypothetical protein
VGRRTVSVPDETIWDKAMKKAHPISLSKVIVQLLKMWLAGKIEIDWDL